MKPVQGGTRSDIAELFLMLTSFSIRAKQFSKALTYSRIGFQMFPDDLSLFEYFVYATLLSGELEDAHDLLKKSDASTSNIYFLKARIAILREASSEEIRRNLTAYLKFTG